MDYITKVKRVCNSFATIKLPVSKRKQVQYILYTLGLEHNIFYTILQVLPTLPTFHELKTKLLQYEAQYINVALDSFAFHVILYANTPASIQRKTIHMITPGFGR